MRKNDGGKKLRRGRVWPRHKVEAVLESFGGEKSITQICQELESPQSTRISTPSVSR